MIVGEGLPFIKNYIQSLNALIKEHSPNSGLSKLQCTWLSFLVLGILVTNSLCWARFERFSAGSYKASALCWVFKKSKIAWDLLLYASTLKIIETYRIKYGVLAIDDTDSERTKDVFDGAEISTKQPQVISQIKKTQLINVNGRYIKVEDFFKNYHGKTEIIQLRHRDKKITYCSGKFKVKAHQKKLFVIALKYEDESEYRYIRACPIAC